MCSGRRTSGKASTRQASSLWTRDTDTGLVSVADPAVWCCQRYQREREQYEAAMEILIKERMESDRALYKAAKVSHLSAEMHLSHLWQR